MRRYFVILPLVFSLLVVGGIFIGTRIAPAPVSFGSTRVEGYKLSQILDYIEDHYVDTISKQELTESTLRNMLMNLDPHSAYISPEELKSVTESLEGNFEGIGVEFNIIKDTLRVIATIPGGPSEKAGIQPGDMIVAVEGKTIAGIKIKSEDVIKKLKGPGGTKVNVSVKRRGVKELLPFTITRGTIPLNSVDAAYMVSGKTGYIKLSRFGARTYEEFTDASGELLSKGMKTLIFDLQDNPGGYLDAAVDICDELLKSGKKIVYTLGKAHPRKDYKAGPEGKLEETEVIILINENSASASEIIAGALQDNDRGTIIGRRSYGKGLVQDQIGLPDGSALRLTVARYYTPSGRCIQKSYENGTEEYYHEEAYRYRRGELFNKDSIHPADSLRYYTTKGKVVYGGGGIIPDVFVPLDTSGQNGFYPKLLTTGVLNQFAYDYADKHREKLKKYESAKEFTDKFMVSDEMYVSFLSYISGNGIAYSAGQAERMKKTVTAQIKAIVARNIYGNTGFFMALNEIDEIYQEAMDVVRSPELGVRSK